MKLLVGIVILLMLTSHVYAIAIGPARREFDFEPNKVIESSFKIASNELPLKVKLSPEYELAQYIELEEINLMLNKKTTEVNYKLRLPDNLDPGTRRGGILVVEDLDIDYKGNMVIAAAGVIHQINVMVPYPGKYVNGKLYITNTNVNEPILFTISLFSYGKEPIKNAKASIYIKGPTNKVIEIIETNTISLAPNQQGKVTAVWQSEYYGLYYAEVVVEYDGDSFILRDVFMIGDLYVDIEDLMFDDFRIGEIVEMKIYLRNKWNKPLDVKGTVKISENNKYVDVFDAMPTELSARSTGTMKAYWDTEYIEVGDYDILTAVNYSGESTERLFSTVVSLDQILVRDSLTGLATTPEEAKISSNFIIVALILASIIGNVMIFMYIKKKLK